MKGKILSSLLLLGLSASVIIIVQNMPPNTDESVKSGVAAIDIVDVPSTQFHQPQESGLEEDVVGSGETEVVMGLTVRKDRNCVVTRHYLPNNDGTTIEAFSCEPISETPRRFAHYTDEALRELAYSDAVASYEFGRRLINREGQEETATEYLLRSIALNDTEIGGIQLIVLQRFWDQFSEERGLEMRSRAYVFNSLATMLDSAYDNRKQESFERLVDSGLTEKDIANLDKESMALLQNLIEIQREVVGNSSIEARVQS